MQENLPVIGAVFHKNRDQLLTNKSVVKLNNWYNSNTFRMLIYQQLLYICKAKNLSLNGNNPTHLKNPYFKGFCSSRFAIDSQKQDALLFTAEHLLVYVSIVGYSAMIIVGSYL